MKRKRVNTSNEHFEVKFENERDGKDLNVFLYQKILEGRKRERKGRGEEEDKKKANIRWTPGVVVVCGVVGGEGKKQSLK